MRQQYLVTLEYADGGRHNTTVWAESPEHAVRKSTARFNQEFDMKIHDAYAERITPSRKEEEE